MKAFRLSLLVGLASVTTILAEPLSLVAQTAPTVQPPPSLDGTWEGKMNDLPAIELKINNSSGKVRGTMLFYFQQREARLWMWDSQDAPKKPGPGLKLERKVEPKSPLGF
jgi:hypothetical protein